MGVNIMQEYNDALCRFAEGTIFSGNNPFLLKLAHAARRAGRTKEEAKIEIWGAYQSQLAGRGEALGNREAEVDRAVEKAYESPLDASIKYINRAHGARKRISLDRNDYQQKISSWRAAQNIDSCEWINRITDYDLREERTTCKTALEAIYRNAPKDGLIWCGKGDADCGPNTFFKLEELYLINAGTEKVSTSVFRDATAGRNAKNILKICAVLVEMDDDLATGKRAENPKKSALEDIAVFLEALGIAPTTITWSGNKSYHVLFRLKTPISVEEFETKKEALKSAYVRCGLDANVVTALRGTRCPRGSRRDEAREGDVQRLVYLDESAEVDFAAFSEKISALADAIGGKEKEEVRHAPCPIFDANATKRAKARKAAEANSEDFDGNEIPEVWKISPVGLENLIDFCGISKMQRGDAESQVQMLIHVDEKNRYQEIEVGFAADQMHETVKNEYGMKVAAEFKRLCSSSLHASSLSAYMGHNTRLNPVTDTASAVYIPYNNGLLKITKEGAELTDYDCEHHVNALEPSLKRNWNPEIQGISEMQMFVENLSGKQEDRPDWRERARAFCTLLGYLICRSKEVVNYLCVVTDEGLKENEGGTGKSRLMEAVANIRYTYYKDFRKDSDKSNRRFYMSDLEITQEFAWMDDAPKGFDYGEFFNLSSGKADIERKGENKHLKIAFDDLPKVGITTNFYPQGTGNSFTRRLRIWETTEHYKHLEHGPYDEFGHKFFTTDWDDDEWARFDKFMARCVQFYLLKGLVQYEGSQKAEKILAANFPKEVLSWLNDTILDEKKELPKKDLPKSYKTWYEESHGGFLKSNYSHETLKDYIESYCKIREIKIADDKNKRVNKEQTRFYNFELPESVAVCSNSVADSEGKSNGSVAVCSTFVAPFSLENQALTYKNATNEEKKEGRGGVPLMNENTIGGVVQGEDEHRAKSTANPCYCGTYDATGALQTATSCYQEEPAGEFFDDAPDARHSKTFSDVAREIHDSWKDTACDDLQSPWHYYAKDESTKRWWLASILQYGKHYDEECQKWPDWQTRQKMADFAKQIKN